MVRDAYANYVVQTTLDVVADEREKHMLMGELYSHSAELVGSKFEATGSQSYNIVITHNVFLLNRKTILLPST